MAAASASTSHPVIGLWIGDPLTRRVIIDGLDASGIAILDLAAVSLTHGCTAILADDKTPEETISVWRESGLDVVPLAGIGRAPHRLGAIIGHARLMAGQGSRALSGQLDFGPFQLSLARLVLTRKETGAVINLTEKERDILARLHREKGGVLDRKTLLEDVWGYAAAVETHTLETHIYRLRQKLENDPGSPITLVTDGNGYRLRLD